MCVGKPCILNYNSHNHNSVEKKRKDPEKMLLSTSTVPIL
jgi:hypothetical protein